MAAAAPAVEGAETARKAPAPRDAAAGFESAEVVGEDAEAAACAWAAAVEPEDAEMDAGDAELDGGDAELDAGAAELDAGDAEALPEDDAEADDVFWTHGGGAGIASAEPDDEFEDLIAEAHDPLEDAAMSGRWHQVAGASEFRARDATDFHMRDDTSLRLKRMAEMFEDHDVADTRMGDDTSLRLKRMAEMIEEAELRKAMDLRDEEEAEDMRRAIEIEELAEQHAKLLEMSDELERADADHPPRPDAVADEAAVADDAAAPETPGDVRAQRRSAEIAAPTGAVEHAAPPSSPTVAVVVECIDDLDDEADCPTIAQPEPSEDAPAAAESPAEPAGELALGDLVGACDVDAAADEEQAVPIIDAPAICDADAAADEEHSAQTPDAPAACNADAAGDEEQAAPILGVETSPIPVEGGEIRVALPPSAVEDDGSEAGLEDTELEMRARYLTLLEKAADQKLALDRTLAEIRGLERALGLLADPAVLAVAGSSPPASSAAPVALASDPPGRAVAAAEPAPKRPRRTATKASAKSVAVVRAQ